MATSTAAPPEAPILLTGATGYVGGRLLAALEARGRRVRCLARHPENLRGRVAASTEVVRGDVLAAESLTAALEGVRTAFYLVHAMGSHGSFVEEDRRGAENFGRAARAAGLERIVYLGGLGDRDAPLSEHLTSRHWPLSSGPSSTDDRVRFVRFIVRRSDHSMTAAIHRTVVASGARHGCGCDARNGSVVGGHGPCDGLRRHPADGPPATKEGGSMSTTTLLIVIILLILLLGGGGYWWRGR